MADTKFMDFAEATAQATDSVLVANSQNGVRRTQLGNLKHLFGGIVAQSLGTTGWVEFADGLLVQWGEIILNGNQAEAELPRPFLNQVPRILVSCSNGNVVPEVFTSVKIDDALTKLTLYASGNVVAGYSYLAIGR